MFVTSPNSDVFNSSISSSSNLDLPIISLILQKSPKLPFFSNSAKAVLKSSNPVPPPIPNPIKLQSKDFLNNPASFVCCWVSIVSLFNF